MNKTILITGATDGIGLETAKKLVMLGHTLLIHGRSPEKLAQTQQTLQSLRDDVQIKTYLADLSDLAEVASLAESILQEQSKLDVLINNAGVYKTNRPITAAGFDARFVVNTLAPYLLSKKLLPLLGTTGRIVNLSSAAQAPVNLNALSGKIHLSDDFDAYAQSKLALTMWSSHVATDSNDKWPLVVSINPGSLLSTKMVKQGFGVEGKDVSIGVDILVRAALAEEFAEASGRYFDNDLGRFSDPHVDALDVQKNKVVVDRVEELVATV